MARPVVLRFVGDSKQLERTLKRLQGQATVTNRILSSIGTGAKAMVGFGRTLSHWVTLPVIAAGAAAATMAVNFEDSLAKIHGLVGISKGTVADWGKAILEMAPKLGKAPRELADALYYVASSGVPASQALDILFQSGKAAAAGLGLTQDVADAVTSALNAFGPTGLSAAQAVDQLTAAVRLGKGEATDFAKEIGKVISPAALLKVRFDEVSAATAVMSRIMSVAEATTALRQVMVTLIHPSQQTRDMLAGIGLKAEDVRKVIEQKGLLTGLALLAHRAKGNTEAFGQLFPNVRALNGFLTLFGPNVAQTAVVFDELTRTAGETDRAFQRATDTTKHKLEKALARLKVAAIQIGGAMLPPIAAVAAEIGKLADKFRALDPAVQRTIIKAALLAAAIGPVVWIIGKLGMALTFLYKHPVVFAIVALGTAMVYAYQHSETFRKIVGALASTLGAAVSFIDQHKAAIGALTLATMTFVGVLVAQRIATTGAHGALWVMKNRAFILRTVILNLRTAMWLLNAAFLANPVGIIIAALAALAMAFVFAWRHSETFRKVVLTGLALMIRAYRAWLSVVLGAFAGIVKGAAKAFGWIPGLGGKLKRASKAFDGFKDAALSKMDEAASKLETKARNQGIKIANGLGSQKPNVALAAGELASAALNGVQNAKTLSALQSAGEVAGDRIGYGFDLALMEREADIIRRWTDIAGKAGNFFQSLGTGMAVTPPAPKAPKAPKVPKFSNDWSPIPTEGEAKKSERAGGVAKRAQERAAKQAKAAAEKAAKAAKKAAEEAAKKAEAAALAARRKAGAPLIKMATDIATGLGDGITRLAKGPLEKAADRLAATIRKQFADKKGKIPKAAEEAIKAMQETVAKATEFRQGVFDNLRGSASLTQFAGTAATTGDMKAFLGRRVQQIKEFAANLRTLAKRGAPPSLLRELAEGGLDAAGVTAALAKSSTLDFKEILSLQAQVDSVATDAANAATAGVFRPKTGSAMQQITNNTKNTTITVNAKTDADPKQIANEVAWILKHEGY